MDIHEINDIEIKGVDFSEQCIDQARIENCVFVNCSFFNTKITNSKLDSVNFISCNMGNTDFSNSKLLDIRFSECKIVGLNLYKCNQNTFDLVFEKSKLDYVNFTDANMKRNKFTDCEITESYFQNTFLPEAEFTNCTFTRTFFTKCDLTKASFKYSEGYSIDPRDCKIKNAVFTMPGVLGLLDLFEIKIE